MNNEYDSRGKPESAKRGVKQEAQNRKIKKKPKHVQEDATTEAAAATEQINKVVEISDNMDLSLAETFRYQKVLKNIKRNRKKR